MSTKTPPTAAELAQELTGYLENVEMFAGILHSEDELNASNVFELESSLEEAANLARKLRGTLEAQERKAEEDAYEEDEDIAEHGDGTTNPAA